jgi:hypothetical protein
MAEEDKDKDEVLVPEVIEQSSPKNTEVLRDEKGRWLKGVNPNTTGRYRKKDPVKEYFKKLCGEDCGDLFNSLVEIAYYDQQKSKDRFPKWRNSDKIKALELLISYGAGKPVQRIEAEVEQKVLQVNFTGEIKDIDVEDIE